jgi:hypothetical protein
MLGELKNFTYQIARNSELRNHVARRYCPDKLLRDENPDQKGNHRKIVRLPNKFSVTYYRSLLNLEAKGQVVLIRGNPQVTEHNGEILRVWLSQKSEGRITLVADPKSPVCEKI